MSYYHHQPPTSGSANDGSNPFGDMMQSAEGRELYTELTGVDMNTFSTNPPFSVPRFLQDDFDPAILHSADAASASYPSQAASTSNPKQHDFRELGMDYTQNNGAYESSYGNTPVAPSGPYSTLHFPTAPMFPPIPMPPPQYPSATISPGDVLNAPVPPNPAPVQLHQKPPRSSALSLNGLPIYSSSGFDMLDILARIATRPQPKIAIGPVDMSCAFLVVDITRDDSPIIYASQTFLDLTGYSEQETLGRNCRFLQAPPGVPLEKGAAREHTDIDSVAQMAQNVSANQECQVTLVNYRKSGEAFINCVSIIPVIPSGNEPIRYHVGFQVDLAVQPLAIMRSVQNGTYVTNYSSTPLPPFALQSSKPSVRGLSKGMSDVLGKIPSSGLTSGVGNESQDRHRLSLALLEECPDAVFVISLKGSFLYVSPSITRLLGYDADYFLNKNIADICHPSDLAPTMRNVKESTSAAATAGNTGSNPLSPASAGPNEIELLFRARRTNGTYVWLDCPVKLHADTLRGRKALLLRLRRVDIPRITWGAINAAGGVHKNDFYLRVTKDERGLIVACSKSVEEVLGRKRDEVVGKTLIEMIVDDGERTKGDAIRAAIGGGGLGGVDTLCTGANPETTPAKVVYCNLPALVSSKRQKKFKARGAAAPTDSADPNGRVMVLAMAELAFFPALEAPDGREEDAASAWRSKLCTIIVRVRVIRRHPMHDNLPEGDTRLTSAYASTSAQGYDALASSAFPSTSGSGVPGYGLGQDEKAFTSLAQQVTSPLSLFQRPEFSGPTSTEGVTRRQGYQVPLSGSVNAVDDFLPGDINPPSSGEGSNDRVAASAGGVTGIRMGSSWLYDLEQLRKRNQALRTELAEVKRERTSKRRARAGSSHNSGHAASRQLSSSGSHNRTRAQLDALASASGLTAMNARRAGGVGGPPGAVAATWPASFPGPSTAGDGSGSAGGNPPRLNLTMPPPPSLPRPQQHSGEESRQRSWSQTDMHAPSEWHR